MLRQSTSGLHSDYKISFVIISLQNSLNLFVFLKVIVIPNAISKVYIKQCVPLY